MHYPSYEFLVELHTHLMRDRWHETYYGPTENEKWAVDQIESWLRVHIRPLPQE